MTALGPVLVFSENNAPRRRQKLSRREIAPPLEIREYSPWTIFPSKIEPVISIDPPEMKTAPPFAKPPNPLAGPNKL